MGLTRWGWTDGQASGLSFPSLPSSPAKWAAAGPMDQGQTGGRAGRQRQAIGHREKEGHCLLKPNQEAKATMQGILSGETDMPFFLPTAAKQSIGSDSLPFHPKQMINK